MVMLYYAFIQYMNSFHRNELETCIEFNNVEPRFNT